MKLTPFLLFALSLFLVACGSEETEEGSDTVQNPAVCSDAVGDDGSDVILSGTIVREESEFTYNEPIEFGPDAHAAVTIRRYEGEDAAAPLTFSADLPFTGFPFEFRLRGDAAAAFDGGPNNFDEFLVGVEVLNHNGCDTMVADLVNESSYRVSGPETGYEIAVSGLESCDADLAGGFCAGP